MGEDTKKNLLIGASSQLATYWNDRENTVFIDSRNINFELLKQEKWNKVFLCFCEQRTFLDFKEHGDKFAEVNVNQTLKLAEELKENCNKVYVYSTAEVWGLKNGPISLIEDSYISDTFEFDTSSAYICSKAKLVEEIEENQDKYNHVIIQFPFNFNSLRRKEGFLFHKVFNSIVNKVKISIGDVNFYRELLHAKYASKQSLLAEKHTIIGSGRVVHIGDFIKSLYKYNKLEYNDFVEERKENSLELKRNVYYLDSKECLYSDVDRMRDYQLDIMFGKKYGMPL